MKSVPYQQFVALLRHLIIRDKDKDIPVLHMHTNLTTLELSGVVTRAEFNRMLAEQANPKAAKAAARKRKDQE